MKKPLISVVIPTYNRKKTIGRAIDSVLNQTFSDFELIIVDDGSTDGTLEYVTEKYGEDSRITYIKLEKNGGVSNARNVGAEEARGEWVAFQDSDDEWLLDKLEKQYAIIKDVDKSVGMVYARILMLYASGERAVIPNRSIKNDYISGDIFPVLLQMPLVPAPTILVRKTVFLERGGYDTTLKSWEDYEFSLRIAEKYKVILVDDALTVAYESADSVNSRHAEQLRLMTVLFNRYMPFYKKYGFEQYWLNLAWSFAGVYDLYDVLEDNYGLFAESEVLRENFLKKEQERVDKYIDSAVHNVAVWVDDRAYNIGDCTKPENGNYGMGDSEYEILLLVRSLVKNKKGIAVTVYHTNENNIMPWGLREVLVRDSYQVIQECLRRRNSILIFSLFQDSQWLSELEKTNIQGIGFLSNPLEWLDNSGYSENLSLCLAVGTVVCLYKGLYDRYRQTPLAVKLNYLYDVQNFEEVMGDQKGKLLPEAIIEKWCKTIENCRRESKYIICTVEGISYVGDAADTNGMYGMLERKKNKDRESLIGFHKLAEKCYGESGSNGYFLDIGANIGTAGIYFIKKLAPKMKLLAFEPVRQSFELLKANVLLNGLDETSVLENCALTDKRDSIAITMPLDNGEVDNTSGTGERLTGEWTSVRLEHYLEKKGISPQEIKYIWIDTGGHEPAVLSGLAEILNRYSLPVAMRLYPEVWRENNTYGELLVVLNNSYRGYISLQDAMAENVNILPISYLMGYYTNPPANPTDIFLIK